MDHILTARRGVPAVYIQSAFSSDSHFYYNRTAYELNYEEIDSYKYDMGHMTNKKPREKIQEVIKI